MPDVPVDIQFDSYDLQDDTIITSDVQGDDSMPKKAMGLYELPVLHGAKKTFEKYNARRITLAGVIKSTTASGLIGKMEEMKEVLSRQDKQLTFSYPSYTRTHQNVSAESGVEFQRPPYAITIADYRVTFVVPEPWTVATTTSVSGVYNVTTPTTSLSVGVSGMLDPQPLIFFNTTASGSRFSITNQTTGDTMDVTTTFSGSGRSLLIDPYNFQVTLDGIPVTYRGTFPRFKPGLNTIVVNTYGTAGSAIDQSFENTAIATYYTPFGKTVYSGQTFVPTRTSISAIELYMGHNKAGDASPATITIEIRTTSGSLPTSTVLGTATITGFSSQTPAWRRAIFSSPVTVTPGTTYAIVAYAAGSNGPYEYNVYFASSNQYASGVWVNSFTAGAQWSSSSPYDLLFRTYADSGTALSGKLVMKYNPRRW